MNKIDFAASGGHYLKINDFVFQNEANKQMFAALALAMVPDGINKVILNGVRFTTDSQSVIMTAGAVYYDGEIYEVAAGDVTQAFDTCFLKIVEAPTGDRPMYVERKMVIDGDSGEIALPELSYRANTAPSGAIQAWHPRPGQSLAQVCDLETGLGKDVWLGWVLCDSRNDSPLMNGRVLVGWAPIGYAEQNVVNDDEYAVLGSGNGLRKVKLGLADLPAHSHSATVEGNGAHQHIIRAGGGASNGSYLRNGEDGSGGQQSVDAGGSGGGHSHTVTIDNAGGDGFHENRQPGRTVAYFQKI